MASSYVNSSHFMKLLIKCFCRWSAKSMIIRLTVFLQWLMEKPYGACLIFTSGRKLVVLVLRRFIFLLFSIEFAPPLLFYSFLFPYYLIICHRTIMKQEVKNQ